MLPGEITTWMDSASEPQKVDLEISMSFEDSLEYEGEGALHIYIYAYWARGIAVKESGPIIYIAVRDVAEPIKVRQIPNPPTSFLDGLVSVHNEPRIEATIITNKAILQDQRDVADCGPWKAELLRLQRRFEDSATFKFIVPESVLWAIDGFNEDFAAMHQGSNKRRKLNDPSQASGS